MRSHRQVMCRRSGGASGPRLLTSTPCCGWNTSAAAHSAWNTKGEPPVTRSRFLHHEYSASLRCAVKHAIAASEGRHTGRLTWLLLSAKSTQRSVGRQAAERMQLGNMQERAPKRTSHALPQQLHTHTHESSQEAERSWCDFLPPECL